MTVESNNPGAGKTDWLSARLAEMDAALGAVEQSNANLQEQLRDQGDKQIAALRAARAQMEKAAKDALDRNTEAFPALKDELQPIWESFEQALTVWADLTQSHEDVLSNQIKAQTRAWTEFFDQYKRSIAGAQKEFRKTWSANFENVENEMAKVQTKAASQENFPWSKMFSAMEEARSKAEKVAEDFQKSLAEHSKK
ncbi:hypothetical protein ACFMBG_08740 [Leisingera sp. D0M16]|uniref:hypothetical protein n=1 Tax=Leisingera coralii TaxID=3351347 RepID=UPI003B806F37